MKERPVRIHATAQPLQGQAQNEINLNQDLPYQDRAFRALPQWPWTRLRYRQMLLLPLLQRLQKVPLLLPLSRSHALLRRHSRPCLLQLLKPYPNPFNQLLHALLYRHRVNHLRLLLLLRGKLHRLVWRVKSPMPKT
jgi:hypothetical protein